MALAMVTVNGLFLRSDPADAGLDPWGEKHKHSSADSPHHHPSLPPAIAYRSIIRNSRFWLIGGSYFAIAYSLYGITTFMVDYAKYQLNVPLEQASLLATIHGVCQIAGVLTVLPLSDYLGRKTTIILSNSIITCCLALILAVGDSLSMLYVVIGVLAVFYGVTFPIYGACAGDYFSREVMGTVIGAWTPFYGLGAILTHWVTGILRDASGVYNQAFVINIVMGALAVGLMCLVRKK
jgi:sugar phosphate permease